MGLIIENLSKTYPNGTAALDEVTFSTGTGMIGLLGPNGAGKSTLMRTLATLQLPDSGSASFDGIDILKSPYPIRRCLGYLPQEFGVYPKQSAYQLLSYFALLKGLAGKANRERMIDHVLELTNLTPHRHHSVHEFSGGMKQRFGIAQLLLNQPRLIIVDEPTAGLDPAERKRFLNLLREIGSERTVLLSTHIVEDVNSLCSDMVILNSGRVLLHGHPAAAVSNLRGRIWKVNLRPDHLETVQSQHLELSSRPLGDGNQEARVYSESPPAGNFEPADPTLEDLYFLTLKMES
jgi:ABC-type multidrug transport system ATPase subunit